MGDRTGTPVRSAGAPSGSRPLGLPPRGCDEREFDDWVRRLTERTDPVMTWLGVVFALLVAAQFAMPTRSTMGTALSWAIWVIWGVFVVDFLLKFTVAPSKLGFLRTHWLTVLGLVLPAFRFLSFLRLLRLGRALPAARAFTTSSRLARNTGRLFRSRVGYLAGLTTIAILLIGEVGYVFENGPGGALPTFGSALLWAAACVIGQSPTVNPETAAGQVTMLAAYVVNLVVIGTLAGTLGAYFLAPHAPAEGDDAHGTSETA